MEKEKNLWDSYGHLYWNLYADLRVLFQHQLRRAWLLTTFSSSHTLHLLLPTRTLAIETMIAYIMALTNEGLVRQPTMSHDMKRENFLQLLHSHKYFQLSWKCFLKSLSISRSWCRENQSPTSFLPRSLTLALISPWYNRRAISLFLISTEIDGCHHQYQLHSTLRLSQENRNISINIKP